MCVAGKIRKQRTRDVILLSYGVEVVLSDIGMFIG